MGSNDREHQRGYHAEVREAAVVGVADPCRGETVKACVSLKPGAKATGADITEVCKGLVVVCKRPHEVEIVDELRKTASAKSMRRELRNYGL